MVTPPLFSWTSRLDPSTMYTQRFHILSRLKFTDAAHTAWKRTRLYISIQTNQYIGDSDNCWQMFIGMMDKLLFTSSVYKWILFLLLVICQTGVQLASGVTCYAAAQISCYQNLTELIELLQQRKETAEGKFEICKAYYALHDCLVPQLSDCDLKEQEMFMDDVVSHLSEPPYGCRNQSVTVFSDGESLGQGSSCPSLNVPSLLYLSTSLYLLHSVINILTHTR